MLMGMYLLFFISQNMTLVFILLQLFESESHPRLTPIYIEETFGLLSLEPHPTPNFIAK